MTRPRDETMEEVDLYARWEAAGWKQEDCGCCAGIEWGGWEPRECRTCKGGGFIWRSPKGKYALYPGGPFCG